MTEASSRPHPLVASTPAALALVFGVSLAWLLTLDLLTPAHEDTARNLLMAADCLADDVCLLSGPTSSFMRLKQGGVFIELLAASRALGLGSAATLVLLGALFAASTAVVVHATRRAADPDVAWGAGALWLAVGVWVFHFPVLDLPVALPLPLAIAWAGALALTRGGGTGAVLAAAVGGAVALNVHIVAGLWLAALGVLVVVASTRPLRAALLFGAAVALVTILLSVDALLYDLEVVEDAGALWLLAAGALLGLGVALALRRRWQSASARVRLVVATTLLGPVYLAALVGLGVAFDKELTPQFWAPALGPIALGFGALLVWGLPGRGSRVALLLVALGASHVFAEELVDVDRAPVDEHTWSLADAEHTGTWLFSGDWAYQDLFGRLQGPNATLLLGAVAPYEPERTCRRASQGDDLLIVRTRRAHVDDLPFPGATLLPLGDTDVAVVRPIASWMRRTALTTCVESMDGSAARRCEDTPLAGDHVTGCPGRSWTERSYPHVPAISRRLLADLDPVATPVTVTFSIPLEPRGKDTARQLRLATPTCDDACCWRIQSVEGLDHEQLPETDGVLIRATRGARGTLHLTRAFGGECDPLLPHFPPDVVELRPDEGSLRALLQMRADPRP